MIRNLSISLITIWSVLMLFSCESTNIVDIEEPESSIVVEAIISTDSTWVVDLSYSQSSADYSEPRPVENAIIKIEAEGNADVESTFFLDDQGNGRYTFGTNPTAGRTYTMTIEADDQVVTATTYVPKGITINNKNIGKQTVIDPVSNQKSVSLEISLTEEYDFDKYYAYEIEALNYVINEMNTVDTGGSKGSKGGHTTTPPSTNGGTRPYNNYSSGFNTKFANIKTNAPLALASGDSGTLVVNHTTIQEASSNYISTQSSSNVNSGGSKTIVNYKLKVWSISEDFYKFLSSINAGDQASSESYSEVYSNINNGDGIFAGYNYKEIIIYNQ